MRFNPFEKIMQYLRRYFGFSRYETYGVLLLLLLCAVGISLPFVLHRYDLYLFKRERWLKRLT